VTIVIWVVGTVFVQSLIALFIAKFIHAGKIKNAVEASSGASQPPRAVSGAGPARAAISNYADLEALLIALAPQPEKALVKEEHASPAILEPKLPGVWPGSSRQ
jgi:hypothetical protein